VKHLNSRSAIHRRVDLDFELSRKVVSHLLARWRRALLDHLAEREADGASAELEQVDVELEAAAGVLVKTTLLLCPCRSMGRYRRRSIPPDCGRTPSRAALTARLGCRLAEPRRRPGRRCPF
jgi:hypothetical protein